MEIVDELFSGSDILIVAVDSDSLFSTKTLTKLFSFQDSLESLEQISKVTSIFNQKYIVPDNNGFEIEPELTAKISKKKKLNIYEVPISIYSRNYDEGKKVKWWDFFIYIYTLVKWKIFD